MALKARIKVNGPIDPKLEHDLVTRYKFSIFSRNGQDWTIFEKYDKRPIPTPFEVLIDGKLPEAVQNMLIRRCTTIVSQFKEPHLYVDAIKNRLNNIKLTLPQHQQKFVQAWMDTNLIESK